MLGLTAEQTEAISHTMATAEGARSYSYPWEMLETDLVGQHPSRLLVLGYGSLVNRTSAGYTLSESTGIPAVAFGVRRIFNYLIPERNPRYGPPPNSMARAALNVIPTGQISDMVNGVLLEVPLGDVAAFRSREVGYDLLPVACIRWHERKKPPFLGYVLHCPDEPRDGLVRTATDIEPHPVYYRVCREGAAEIGDSFLDLWLATTYLADRATPVGQWEREAQGLEL
ncbi:MAG: hypothetical protein GTO22_18970 [Gemmatimonadales bacterium]|nr:hypothetical protein [Gemmatimonadales bacterium]